jgi:hypothetical protein
MIIPMKKNYLAETFMKPPPKKGSVKPENPKTKRDKYLVFEPH